MAGSFHPRQPCSQLSKLNLHIPWQLETTWHFGLTQLVTRSQPTSLFANATRGRVCHCRNCARRLTGESCWTQPQNRSDSVIPCHHTTIIHHTFSSFPAKRVVRKFVYRLILYVHACWGTFQNDNTTACQKDRSRPGNKTSWARTATSFLGYAISSRSQDWQLIAVNNMSTTQHLRAWSKSCKFLQYLNV